jgi:S-formylglutathione hydrolase FrmB
LGSWSLITGWLPWVLTVTGMVALASLLVSRRRVFWIRVLPIVVGACAGLVLLTEVAVDVFWQPFPDRVPVNNLVWTWIGLTGLALAAVRMRRIGWRRRAGAVVAAVMVVVAAGVQVNSYWGAYPTLHSLREAFTSPQNRPLPTSLREIRPVVDARPGATMLDTWRPPAGMPNAGTVSKVSIPGTLSHFPARSGYVYLPPAYLVVPRPVLPVVVLLSGQPGSPEGWTAMLRMPEALDAFARAHNGLAPVAVVPDDLGSTMANPLCVDSPLGNAETYLTRDVPAWIRATLQVTQDRQGWFVGGFSHGGTCALQLAVRAPKVYGGFVDISGQREPTLGSRSKTVQRAFGGSEAAFMRVNPLDVLKNSRFPDSAGFVAVGTDDQTYLPQQREVHAACAAAGMDMKWLELPGGHTMTVWREAFVRSLPWLAARSRLAGS